MDNYYDEIINDDFQDHDNLDTFEKKQGGKNNFSSYKHLDKHFHSLKFPCRKVKANGKLQLSETIECYSTPYSGSRIRDAMSGEYSKYFVGTYEESLFFKVVIAVGSSENGPVHLYYLSPEQYEQHHQTHVDAEVKADWQKTYVRVCDHLGL